MCLQSGHYTCRIQTTRVQNFTKTHPQLFAPFPLFLCKWATLVRRTIPEKKPTKGGLDKQIRAPSCFHPFHVAPLSRELWEAAFRWFFERKKKGFKACVFCDGLKGLKYRAKGGLCKYRYFRGMKSLQLKPFTLCRRLARMAGFRGGVWILWIYSNAWQGPTDHPGCVYLEFQPHLLEHLFSAVGLNIQSPSAATGICFPNNNFQSDQIWIAHLSLPNKMPCLAVLSLEHLLQPRQLTVKINMKLRSSGDWTPRKFSEPSTHAAAKSGAAWSARCMVGATQRSHP